MTGAARERTLRRYWKHGRLSSARGGGGADNRLHTRGGIEFEQSRTVSELLKKAKDKAAGTASAIKFSYELVEAAGGEHASSRAS
jgi:hypothetical protein